MMLRGVYLGLVVGIVSLIFFYRAVYVVFMHRQQAILDWPVLARLATGFLEGMGIGFVVAVVGVILLRQILAHFFSAA